MKSLGENVLNKPKTKPPPLDDAEQSARFMETAENLGADKTSADFEQLVGTISDQREKAAISKKVKQKQ
jgi:hypothetical protein